MPNNVVAAGHRASGNKTVLKKCQRNFFVHEHISLFDNIVAFYWLTEVKYVK